MRRARRLAVLATLLAVAPVLAGCENFDPDSLDFLHLNEKKKLPGERHEVFPNGVPGVTQGVPPQYLKGYQEATENPDVLPPASDVNPGDENAAAVAKPEHPVAAAAPAHKAKRKRKPKAVAARHAPAKVTVHAAPAGTQSPWPATTAQTSPWPAPGQQQAPSPAPAQQQTPWPEPNQTTAPTQWPAPPPPGTFSKQ